MPNLLGIDAVQNISDSVPVTSDITVRLHSVMGVEIPDLDPLDDETVPSYSSSLPQVPWMLPTRTFAR